MVAVSRFRALLRRESEATGLPLGALLALAAVVHLGVMWLSVNPWHPDEHFQILEFAWSRAGLAPPGDLPWEWDARIRPTLQPALALLVLRGLRALGMQTPFPWLLLLRTATLALSLGVLVRLFVHVGPELSRAGRRALWLSGLFLWFAPLFLFRFSSENLGGICFVAAMTLVAFERHGADTAPGPHEETSRRGDLLAGMLMGLSFVFRFQMAFAVAPVFLWVGLRRPGGVAVATRMVAGAAAVVAVATLVDAWFYGAWVFTPWRYFHSNIVEGVATTFGTEPWYWYGAFAPLWMAPPVGLAIAVLVMVALIKHPGSPWSWAFVSFLVGHSLVAHKEIRFLFPLLYFLPVMLGRGIHVAAQAADWSRGWRSWAAGFLVVLNLLLLALLATPAIHRGREVDVHYLRWLWDRAESFPGDTVYVLQEATTPYLVVGLPANVYRHPRVVGIQIADGAPVPRSIPPGTPPDRVLLLARGGHYPTVAGGTVGETVYEAEAGYRVMMRRLGVLDAGWIRWLERLEGWPSDPDTRQVAELHLAPAVADTAPGEVTP